LWIDPVCLNSVGATLFPHRALAFFFCRRLLAFIALPPFSSHAVVSLDLLSASSLPFYALPVNGACDLWNDQQPRTCPGFWLFSVHPLSVHTCCSIPPPSVPSAGPRLHVPPPLIFTVSLFLFFVSRLPQFWYPWDSCFFPLPKFPTSSPPLRLSSTFSRQCGLPGGQVSSRPLFCPRIRTPRWVDHFSPHRVTPYYPGFLLSLPHWVSPPPRDFTLSRPGV